MRVPVPLRRAYRLLNHGPTTLVGAAHGGRANVMAAAWAMPLDYDPPKVAVVIAADTFTRGLIEASGEFALSVPVAAQVDVVYALGSRSGHEGDKLGALGVTTFAGSHVAAPLVDGAAAWLECKVVPEPHAQQAYDLFVAEVVAAWADDALFDGNSWTFPDDAHRTIHHVARGEFHRTGGVVRAKELP